MLKTKDTIAVNTNVTMTTASLEAIVDNARNIAGRNEKGFYSIDTAEIVNEMISRFLLGNDFEEYVKNIENYEKK